MWTVSHFLSGVSHRAYHGYFSNLGWWREEINDDMMELYGTTIKAGNTTYFYMITKWDPPVMFVGV